MNRLIAFIGVALLARAAAAQPIDVDMFIGSSAQGSGALRMAYDFCRPVVVTESLTVDGLTRWTSTQPGFNALAVSRPGSIYVLRDTTPIEVVLRAVDPGVTLKVGSTVLDAPGSMALIGNVPDVHLHPEWRLLLPEGQGGEFHLQLSLHTGATAYDDSPIYRFTITTVAGSDGCGDGETTTTTLPPATNDRLVAGTTLLLRASPSNAAKKAMTLTFGDAFDPASTDPTVTGGQLRILSNAANSFEGRHELPASRWKPLRKHGTLRGYRYKDRRGAIRSIVWTFGGLVRVQGRGAGLKHSLAGDPEPVDVALALGAERACLHFGGTVSYSPGKSFRADNAAPPAACAP
ncbi:MAG TPA: hypothetical protein VMS22_08270 [Candidatus Eisenbacteria bacterium]|nr:hypothetical protein [Candidatus Eisenbacteria bacterium]